MADIYVNVEELKTHQQAEVGTKRGSGSKHVNKRPFWGVIGLLGLLSISLLTAFIIINVLYGFSMAELTAVKNNLSEILEVNRFKLYNLTEERNQLNVSLNEMTKEVERLQNLSKQKKTCPEGWRMFQCSCYFFSTESGTWDKGREDCKRRGADLVVIESQAEKDFLAPWTKKWMWIGLTDREREGSWKWVDGSLLIFTSWNNNQPDNGGGDQQFGEEDCVDIMSDSSNWNDLSCETSQLWICEKNAAPLL